MKAGLVIAAFVVALLALTNPSRDAFDDWAQFHVSQRIAEETDGKPNDGAALIGGALAGLFISNMPIERTNLLVFSIYEARLPSWDAEHEVCRFLGLAGQFVPLGKCLAD
ncbi:MAG: hypothetical protein ACKOZX_09260 [Gammaproteobacteria bacterium]